MKTKKKSAKKKKSKKKECNHNYRHKKGTWYLKCTRKDCGHEVFLGLGHPPALNMVCNSHRQKECLLDTAKCGQMDPDACYPCNDFY